MSVAHREGAFDSVLLITVGLIRFWEGYRDTCGYVKLVGSNLVNCWKLTIIY